MEDGSVEIYSRNAERNTGKYPDVVDAVSRYTPFYIFAYKCISESPTLEALEMTQYNFKKEKETTEC